MKVHEKEPYGDKTYSIDWSRDLGSKTISSSSWEVSGGTLSSANDTETATVASTELSGGAAGELSIVTNKITDSDGEHHARSFAVRIRTL